MVPVRARLKSSACKIPKSKRESPPRRRNIMLKTAFVVGPSFLSRHESSPTRLAPRLNKPPSLAPRLELREPIIRRGGLPPPPRPLVGAGCSAFSVRPRLAFSRLPPDEWAGAEIVLRTARLAPPGETAESPASDFPWGSLLAPPSGERTSSKPPGPRPGLRAPTPPDAGPPLPPRPTCRHEARKASSSRVRMRRRRWSYKDESGSRRHASCPSWKQKEVQILRAPN